MAKPVFSHESHFFIRVAAIRMGLAAKFDQSFFELLVLKGICDFQK